MTQTADDRTRDQPDLAHVIELLNVKLERGEAIDLEAIVKEHPQYAAQLQDLLPAMAALMDLSTPAGRDNGRVSPSVSDGASELRRLGDFRIGREIGRGGMGVVYEAEQVSLGRKVALKVLPFAAVLDKKCLQRFQTEARVAATLDHPNIVSIFSVGCENAVYFYSMQLIEGQSLAEAVAQLKLDREDGKNGVSLSKGRQDLPHVQTSPLTALSTRNSNGNREFCRTVAKLGIQVAEALHYAHDLGIVHRDIKPSNLLLDADGKIWVADFGLAMIQKDADLTRTGDLVGTLRYMSPEAVSGNRAIVNHLTDVYSLGATLYELLALQPAHQANTHHELLQQIAVEEPTPLRRINSEIPVELETIVQKAMCKDLHHRYASAQELADDLRAHLDHRPIKAKPPTVSETIGKWTRRNPAWTWAAIITMALVTLTLAVSLLFVFNARNAAASRADELARRNYLLYLANANRALLVNDYFRAGVELERCPEEYRGWEWHFLQRRLRATIPHSFSGAEQPIFCREGKWLIAIGGSGTPEHRMANIWDLSSGLLVKALEHESRLSHIALSPDERQIAAGDYEGKLFVWNIETENKVWSVREHDVRLTCVAFSPDGKKIATVSKDAVRVHDAKTGEMQFSVPLAGNLRKVMFSPDGRWLATSSHSAQQPAAVLIDVATGKVAVTFPDDIHQLPTFDPSGRQIATSSPSDDSINLWEWDGEQLVLQRSWPAGTKKHPAPDSSKVVALYFSADGRLLVSGGNPVKVWDVATGQELANMDTKGHGAFWLATSPTDSLIAFFTIDHGIRCWRYSGQQESLSVKPLDSAVSVSFSPNGQHIAASSVAAYRSPSSDSQTSVLDANSGATVLELEGETRSASWTSDRKHIVAVADRPPEIRLYSASTGTTTRAFTANANVFSTAVAQSGEQLTAFLMDGSICVWNLDSGEKLAEFSACPVGLDTEVTSVGISPDSNRVGVAIHPNYRFDVWDVRTKSLVRPIATPGLGARAIVFSRDGNDIYVGANGGALIGFDLNLGKQNKLFAHHWQRIRSIALSPDEQQIVSGDDSGKVIVWDVATQEPLVTLIDDGEIIMSVDWSSDGQRIAAGKADGTVQIWTLPRLPTAGIDRDTGG